MLSKLIIFDLNLFNWELKRNNRPSHFSVRVIYRWGISRLTPLWGISRLTPLWGISRLTPLWGISRLTPLYPTKGLSYAPGTHVTHFVQLYPQPLYTASQMRSWDKGVLTDLCLTLYLLKNNLSFVQEQTTNLHTHTHTHTHTFNFISLVAIQYTNLHRNPLPIAPFSMRIIHTREIFPTVKFGCIVMKGTEYFDFR